MADPDALALLGGLVLDDGRTWAEAAQPFQLADADAALAPPERGPRRHYWLRPRGASKTTDAAALALALLLTEAPPAPDRTPMRWTPTRPVSSWTPSAGS